MNGFSRLESVKHLKGKHLQGMPLYALLDSNSQFIRQEKITRLDRQGRAAFGVAQKMLYQIDDRACFIQQVVPVNSAAISRMLFNGRHKSYLLFSVHSPDKNLIRAGTPLRVKESLFEMMQKELFSSDDLDKSLQNKFMFPDTFHTACLLVELGANIHTDCRGSLRDAFLSGSEPSVRFLMEHGARLPDSNKGTDPFYEEFFFADGMPDADCLRLLLKYGMDVHYNNDALLRGAPICLTEPAKFQDERACEKVKLLLDKGADIHACGEETLANAIWCQRPDCVQLLLNNGAAFLTAMFDHGVFKKSHSLLVIIKILLNNGVNAAELQNILPIRGVFSFLLKYSNLFG